MWAQLMKMRVAEGAFDRFEEAGRQWEEKVGRGTDSGWVRSILLRSVTDPNELYELVYFESEEKARANEKSPQHLEVVSTLMDMVEGPPEYVDLIPVEESTR